MNKNFSVEEFENFMQQEIDRYNGEDIIKEAIKYSLISNGKYFRPQLLIESVDEFSTKKDDIYLLAMAIEMIHTYSLIHDDLPAMDNDDFRRGNLTNHKKYGEDIAILSGDALLTHCFENVAKTKKINEKVKNEIILEIVKAIGIDAGMINGQILDIHNGDKDLKYLYKLHEQKTGKLIALPLIISALINGDDKLTYEKLGIKLGVLYQIQDDYLDLYGDEKVLGKKQGQDQKTGKITFTNYYSQKELEKLIQSYGNEILNIVRSEAKLNKIESLIVRIIERVK